MNEFRDIRFGKSLTCWAIFAPFMVADEDNLSLYIHHSAALLIPQTKHPSFRDEGNSVGFCFIFPICFATLCTSFHFLTGVGRPFTNKWFPKEFLLTLKPESCQRKWEMFKHFLRAHFYFPLITKNKKQTNKGNQLYVSKVCTEETLIREKVTNV